MQKQELYGEYVLLLRRPDVMLHTCRTVQKTGRVGTDRLPKQKRSQKRAT